jgi:peptidoglycan/LPS O-acetylase OafA/YrhL
MRFLKMNASRLMWCGVVGLVIVIIYWTTPAVMLVLNKTLLTRTFLPVLTSVSTVLLIVSFIMKPQSVVSRALSAIAWPGRHLSYGMYLWQYVVLVAVLSLGTIDMNNPVLFLIVTPITIVLSLLSSKFLEEPIRQRVHKWTRR